MKISAQKQLHKLKILLVNHGILILFAALFLIPIWYTIVSAFKLDRYIFTQPLSITAASFTVSNIVRAFRIMQYPRMFFNSMMILGISCLMLIIFGSMAAYGIAMARHKFFERMYGFFIILITLPFQLAMVPLISMLKNMNLINTFLGTSLVYGGFYMSFVIFLYTGFIRSIPSELEDAARVDGCGLLKMYIYIYFPLLKTITGVILILRGVAIWNDLLIPLITITRTANATLPLRLMSFVGSYYTSWGLVFGGTLLVSLPILCIFLLLQRFFVKGIMAGAIKQ